MAPKNKNVDKGKNADTKGKGKGKAKDDGEESGGKGKGLKAANSINVRHILVCLSLSYMDFVSAFTFLIPMLILSLVMELACI